MGLYLNVHLGGFIKVKDRLEKELGPKTTCHNSICENYLTPIYLGDYCLKCGEKIVTKNVEYNVVRDVSVVSCKEKYEDRMFQPYLKGEFSFLVSNNDTGRPISPKIEEGNCAGFHSVTPDEITKDLIWFKATYSDIISELKEYFGDENVEICWGPIIHYH